MLNTSNNKTQDIDNKAVEDSSPEELKLVYQEVSKSHLVLSISPLPPPHLPPHKTNITDLKNKVLCRNIYICLLMVQSCIYILYSLLSLLN